MSDREMLECAAKAAGIGPLSWIEPDGTKIVTNVRWNPLTDDGDALRLAVKLGLFDLDELLCRYGNDPLIDTGKDIYAATRRAIVRAAAEIGRNMP